MHALNGISIQITLKKKLEPNFYREFSRKHALIEIKVNTEMNMKISSQIFSFFFVETQNMNQFCTSIFSHDIFMWGIATHKKNVYPD